MRRRFLLSRAVKSCTHPSHLHQLHAHMLKSGLSLSPFPFSKLLAAAAALLDASHASALFRGYPAPNLFMCNTVLRAHSIAQDPDLEQSISLFDSMRARAFLLDQFSFITVAKICARTSAIEVGRQVHGIIVKSGFQFFVNVFNTMIHFYCACCRINDARRLFDEIPWVRDAVSWTTLMGGFLRDGQPCRAMDLFREMQMCRGDITSTAVVSALSALIIARCLDESFHGYCKKNGFCMDLNVATVIATMYAKYGCMDSARKVFDEMTRRDVVLYNSMIDGYAKAGLIEESLALLQQMEGDRVRPNTTTFVGLLSACASSGALVVGCRIHQYIEEEAMEFDTVLGTALIDMYSKCGCLDDAMEVFDQMRVKDVKAWTAMIMGFGINGEANAAMEMFYKMEEEGMRPNEVTFLAVLSACSHGGTVAAAKAFLESMVRDYRLSPKIEHYGCVIDLLGRAGLLEEAHELIKSLPSRGDATAWRALLAACKVHGNAELGELARQALVAMDDEHPTNSILLSSTYALKGRWIDVAQIRDSENERMMIKKKAGCSSIEVTG